MIDILASEVGIRIHFAPAAYNRENLTALTIILEQVVILSGCLPFHPLKVPWLWLKPQDF
ncbi:MAG: hypothetical protein EWV41_00035 [Microcystis wesenbergii Mw_MB_S_20031200_S109]|uniref:Uncharacterized protein n=1 Tax=Microcystis wesenbergii Mw_MB_S_20031200_S109D TaxID=2486241 RepID=A0A552LWA4_9CHRO|nr:MAG: hypothetical protein EWV73_11135 [Microcystis wesenbergii Mw_QC_B_20070930_S4D]TRV15111.1 MAG: hypothetical protein EWV41_00035 [Microcystis wesenbergii Mw_MB_S_20031200_S109]TRV16798.1 MAG: hypothetical protein EWV89_04505 [Microcystis wesenbergii Mw_QC_B_20070930_S4]TRV24501.1 MAG: hypothetical protein EWV88_09430 [Microcystis wesenbergii Mw_MB_S_20031200_S109D]